MEAHICDFAKACTSVKQIYLFNNEIEFFLIVLFEYWI